MRRPDDDAILDLAIRYEEGESFEALALDTGCAVDSMRRWLDGLVESRGPGGVRGRKNRPRPGHSAPTQKSVGVRGVLASSRTAKHRHGFIS